MGGYKTDFGSRTTLCRYTQHTLCVSRSSNPFNTNADLRSGYEAGDYLLRAEIIGSYQFIASLKDSMRLTRIVQHYTRLIQRTT